MLKLHKKKQMVGGGGGGGPAKRDVLFEWGQSQRDKVSVTYFMGDAFGTNLC